MYTDSQAAVAESLRADRALLVYVDNAGSSQFWDERISGELAPDVERSLVTLRVDVGSDDYRNFQMVIPKLTVPSFNILKKNQVVDIIGDDVSLEEARSRVLKLVKPAPASGARETAAAPAVAETPAAPTTSLLSTTTTPVAPKPARVQKLINETRPAKVPKKQQKPEVKAPKPRRLLTPTLCILSIKLFEGNSVRHEFKPSDTLKTVREWLDNHDEFEVIPNSDTVPSFASTTSPIGYVFCRPMALDFSSEEEEKLLLLLDLCPRLALILKPIYQSPNAANENRRSLLGSIGGSVMALGLALFSFFDYGVSDAIEEESRANTPLPDESMEPSHPPLMTINTNQSTEGILRQSSRASTPRPPSRVLRNQSFQLFDHSNDNDMDYFNGNLINLHDDDRK